MLHEASSCSSADCKDSYYTPNPIAHKHGEWAYCVILVVFGALVSAVGNVSVVNHLLMLEFPLFPANHLPRVLGWTQVLVVWVVAYTGHFHAFAACLLFE